ncbi:hypothetical protein TWF706_000752 [Orbilia oligospora]|nr:hypothetical protein TWF706_000752 [Orbilia oligospora]
MPPKTSNPVKNYPSASESSPKVYRKPDKGKKAVMQSPAVPTRSSPRLNRKIGNTPIIPPNATQSERFNIWQSHGAAQASEEQSQNLLDLEEEIGSGSGRKDLEAKSSDTANNVENFINTMQTNHSAPPDTEPPLPDYSSFQNQVGNSKPAFHGQFQGSPSVAQNVNENSPEWQMRDRQSSNSSSSGEEPGTWHKKKKEQPFPTVEDAEDEDGGRSSAPAGPSKFSEPLPPRPSPTASGKPNNKNNVNFNKGASGRDEHSTLPTNKRPRSPVPPRKAGPTRNMAPAGNRGSGGNARNGVPPRDTMPSRNFGHRTPEAGSDVSMNSGAEDYDTEDSEIEDYYLINGFEVHPTEPTFVGWCHRGKLHRRQFFVIEAGYPNEQWAVENTSEQLRKENTDVGKTSTYEEVAL